MNIASYIDHTLLSQTATSQDIGRLCEEALTSHFAAVCVPPYYVRQADEILRGTEVKLATVVGFPFGYQTTESKLREIDCALSNGAEEIDMVHNIAALKTNDWHHLETEITACLHAVKSAGMKMKVIIESGILSDTEIEHCCTLYQEHVIDYLKTSTGYAHTGATIHAVQLMRRNLPQSIAIKASGGIRNFAFAQELILAGATRLGCSASLQILEESKL